VGSLQSSSRWLRLLHVCAGLRDRIGDPGRGNFDRLMLPHTHHRPTRLAQREVDPAIAIGVPLVFDDQYCEFALGEEPCCGQRCQKQPSTNTATRAKGKTAPGRLRTPSASMSSFFLNLSPAR
jgi:hypothetical protein